MPSFVPCTPGGSMLFNLEADTADQARIWLCEDSAHMPYNGWIDRYKRGYRIFEEDEHGYYKEIREKPPEEPTAAVAAVRDPDPAR